MKRTVFIVGGIGIVLLLITVWMYILLTGTTSETVIFNDFGFGDTTDNSVVIQEEPEPEPEVTQSIAPDRLRQLTTKPVVGFSEVQLSSTSPRTINYVEAGTGHIYTIDLATEVEERVSATTIPLASKAALTPNGRNVMVQSGSGAGAEVIIGTLSTSSDQMSNFILNEAVVDFAATTENEFVFSTVLGNELVVKVYRPAGNQISTLFTIPFRDATISWHHTTAGPHIVYPKATSRLEGYVYTVTNGTMSRVAASGYGLSAVGSATEVIYSTINDDEYNTFHTNTTDLQSINTPLTFIPEKCRFTTIDDTIALCGTTLTDFSYLMPDPWYQGTISMNDDIWEYDTNTQSASLLISPERDSGRQIDIINPVFGRNDRYLYFQNKTDQALWVYEYLPASVLGN